MPMEEQVTVIFAVGQGVMDDVPVERIRECEGQMLRHLRDLPSEGFWCRPTLFLDAAQSPRIVQEEIFGPVLAVQTFRTTEEAIKKANNTPYGLSGGVWTDKGAKAFRVTSELRAGVLWANTFNKFDPASPFGGYKESGVGREGGLHGLAAYLDLEPIAGSNGAPR